MNKTNLQELLPLGSIVTLKKGTKKIMICGRIQEEATTKKIYDYAAFYYPEGILNPHELFLFQHEDVEFVYFVGMQDSEEFSFRDFLIGKLKEKGMLET